jgi:hypothetical protein
VKKSRPPGTNLMFVHYDPIPSGGAWGDCGFTVSYGGPEWIDSVALGFVEALEGDLLPELERTDRYVWKSNASSLGIWGDKQQLLRALDKHLGDIWQLYDYNIETRVYGHQTERPFTRKIGEFVFISNRQ